MKIKHSIFALPLLLIFTSCNWSNSSSDPALNSINGKWMLNKNEASTQFFNNYRSFFYRSKLESTEEFVRKSIPCDSGSFVQILTTKLGNIELDSCLIAFSYMGGDPTVLKYSFFMPIKRVGDRLLYKRYAELKYGAYYNAPDVEFVFSANADSNGQDNELVIVLKDMYRIEPDGDNDLGFCCIDFDMVDILDFNYSAMDSQMLVTYPKGVNKKMDCGNELCNWNESSIKAKLRSLGF